MRVRLDVMLVTTVAGAAFLAVAMVGPGTSSAVSEPPPPAAGSPENGTDVEHVFLRDCATCHGADAHGTDLGPSLRGAGAALVDYYVSTGRMPLPTTDPNAVPERSTPKYTPATIRKLVRYVTALAGGDGPPIPDVHPARGDLAAGGELYRLNCAACHSWAGTGGALVDRSAPSLHPASPKQAAEAIRGGPGTMPAFGTASLSPHQVDAVVRYVESLRRPDDRGGVALWHVGPLAEGAAAILVGLGILVFAVRRIGTRT
jgi:ubiquinol-cytochrome c reductase cytochrome c subunit